MNVLSHGRVPKVMALREVLREWLDHRREVLLRRSRHRLAEIERRLEVLGGLLIAYLNLDEVIRIIREEDEPKPALIERFELTDIQAEAILNMRLRACASSRKSRSARSTTACRPKRRRSRRCWGPEERSGRCIAGEIGEIQEEVRAGHRARQAPHDVRRGARP